MLTSDSLERMNGVFRKQITTTIGISNKAYSILDKRMRKHSEESAAISIIDMTGISPIRLDVGLEAWQRRQWH